MKTVLVVSALILTVASAQAGRDTGLSGHWSGGGFELVLTPDGGGTLQDSAYSPAEPIRWKAGNGKLTLTRDGEATTYDYLLDSAGRLHASGGDLDEPVTLSRGRTAHEKPAKDPGAVSKPKNAAVKPGNCAGSCRHLLACAKNPDPQIQQACILSCGHARYDSDFLGWFEATDCRTAIAVGAYLDAQNRGIRQQAVKQSKGSQCDGCVWDGSECNWYSQGNWGSNVAFSGAVVSCDRSCCGH